MGKLLLIEEDDLQKIIMTCLDSYFKGQGAGNIINSNSPSDDELITNLVQIGELCHCSLPTAQKIKDAIPPDQYMQVDKTFAIKKSILLTANNKRKNKS